MSASTSETCLAYTILVRGGVVLRTIGDAMRYLDTCREGIERSALRVMLQQAHWYGQNLETATHRLFRFLENEGLVFRHAAMRQPLPLR